MTLETLVTALACLSTTTTTTTTITNGPKSMAVIMQNSVEPFKVDNATLGGCPVGTLSGLASRIQYMTEELQTLQMDLTELQQLINDYKNEQPVYRLDSRIGPSSLSAVVGQSVAAAGSVDDTPRSCWDQKHGEVRIRPGPDMQPFFVNCDQKVRDGGWTVIAYRYDGSEDFNRNWENYKAGFGSLKGEFFIGLDKLHRLTNSADHELLILMQSQTKEQRFALYDQFSIGNEAEKYLMYLLGTYKGDAGDSLRYHAGKKFTTFDQDNDDNGQNCARTHAGAWWYGRECFESNLFGTFQSKYGQEIGYFKGILWKTFVPGPTGSLRYVRMLIRPLKKT